MRRASATVCLLILLALGAWLLRPSDDAAAPELERENPSASTYTPDATLVGTKTDQPGAAQPDAPVVEPSAEGVVRPANRILWKVTIRVEGEAGVVAFDPPAKLTIHEHVMRFDSFMGFAPVEHELVKSGKLEIDMTKQLTEMAKRHSHEAVSISLRHPGYMPFDRRVPIAELKAVAAGTKTLLPLDLTLQAAGVLRGQVVDREGEPVAKAATLLYRMIDGEPESAPVSISESGPGGRYELPFSDEGRYLLVAAFTRHGGLRVIERLLPGSAQLDLSRDAPAAPVRVVLRPGHMLLGTVTVSGAAPEFTGISWRIAGASKRLMMSSDETDQFGLAYADAQVHWGWGHVSSSPYASGRFDIHGLSPRACHVHVEGTQGMITHPRARNQVAQVVSPPRNDVAFDLRPAHIHVLVRTPRGVAGGLKIGISSVGMAPDLPEGVVWSSTPGTTDSQGQFEFDVQPDTEWALTVRDPRYEVVFHPVSAPAVGATTEVELDLVEIKTKPALVVSLEGRGVDALFGASFARSVTRADGGATGPQVLSDFLRAKGGQLKLPNVPAGSWRLHVRPDRRWNAAPTTWLDAVVEVDVADTGATAVRVPLSRGGRVHLDVTDPGGRYLKAQCVLRDATGSVLPVTFLSENDWGGKILSRGTLPGSHDCWLSKALPAGTYTLEFTLDGHRQETRRIVVRKGGTARAQLVMAPLR